MSNELERKHVSAPRHGGKTVQRVFLYLWHMLRHNLGWKVLALFLAVALWAGLITQDPTLTREKTFTDVPVTVVGKDTLKNNGFIVLNELSSSVRLKVDVPQTEYGNVTAANYNVRVDLSRITTAGEQEVKITAASTSAYGSVVEIVPDTLTINVEAFITRYRIPVTVVREGDPPANYYSNAPTIDPPTVAISGPASLVNRVSRAVATYDQSVLPAREGLVRSGVLFVLVDDSGAEVNSDLIQVTNESVLLKRVVVEQTLYETKTIDLSQKILTTGTPDAGYQVKSITVTPSQIVAAGRPESLEQIDQLFLESPVNITGVTESFTSVIKVQKPSGIENLSSSSVTVMVEIEPVRINRTFDDLRIDTLGLAEGYALSADKSRASVTINGPKTWVDKLKSGDITLSADLTGLKEGTHNVPLLCSVADGEQIDYTYATDPAIIQAELTVK